MLVSAFPRCTARPQCAVVMGDVQAVDVPAVPVWAHACHLDDLALPYALPARAAECLDLGPGWPRTWTVTWKVVKSDVIVPVKDLSAGPAVVSVPVRRFAWRTGQRHRPGLECLVSTGRQHGFESLAERRVRRADHGRSHPGHGRVHALAGRFPAHAGIGRLHRGGHVAAGRDAAAADAPGLDAGHGVALPRRPSRAGHRVRRPSGRRAAVLRAGDGDQRSRQRLQEPPPGPGRPHAGDGGAAGEGDAPAGQGGLRSPRYISDDRARLAVTAYSWTQVTLGETQFAPRPPEARNNPELDATWSQDRFTIGHWLRQNKVPFYQQLKPLLDAYAEQLSHDIDTEHSSGQLSRSLAN
ncbi:hypothetical protein RKD23_000022 [Streptomyces sp. SAI-170]